LISLKIQNLILIEKAEIAFGPGLNILTGETGSGKSAVLSAIRLISGERADSGCIRKGADFAVVEAVLEGPKIIRREIYRSGKNRCFIDDAQVSLTALREAVDIEMVDQSNSHSILEEQKRMLDLFANLLSEVATYDASYAEEKSLSAELQTLLQTPKDRELEWAQKDLNLIEEVNWKLGEEEKLAEEHHFLTHAQELAEKMSSIAYTLTEGTEVPTLKRVLSSLEHCIRFDAKLTPLAQSMKSALLELEEAGRSIQSYTDKLEADPNRLTAVETRIGAIESLKRRFGSNIDEQKAKLLATIDHLTNLDAQIETLQSTLQTIREKNQKLAQTITRKRQKAAPLFSAQVLDELKSLNIPHAKFEIIVGETFNDVRFLFSANPGLPAIPLEECASGGEQSRLLLAVKTILADGRSCLVFDEIDSNVGGQTATILGQKLKRLAEKRQVICVTHFVQVAKCAMEHFLVSKATKNETAITSVIKLSEPEREIEYSRMLGNKT
jgi:DNA repair protein RecN (Recombination protein N)